jgi:hypothetical protein
MSLKEELNSDKSFFDEAFTRENWSVHPSIIAFLTAMKVDETKQALQIYVAPANHNRLAEAYTLHIVNTLLGNSYQSNHDQTVHNQDLGLDACVIVGYNTNDETQRKDNMVEMKKMHPAATTIQDQGGRLCVSFMPDDKSKYAVLKDKTFKELLTTNAMTNQGQDEVAKFYNIIDEWKKYNDENSEASLIRKYFDLLVLVKSKSSNDKIWIIFWEGLHRHAAIILTHLLSGFSYKKGLMFEHNSLTTETMKKAGIHGFTDPNKTPSQIMEKIISGKRKAPLLSNLFSITAYIPTMKQGHTVATIMRVTTSQSELISKNK